MVAVFSPLWRGSQNMCDVMQRKTPFKLTEIHISLQDPSRITNGGKTGSLPQNGQNGSVRNMINVIMVNTIGRVTDIEIYN